MPASATPLRLLSPAETPARSAPRPSSAAAAGRPTASNLAAAHRARRETQPEANPHAHGEPVIRAGAGRAHRARGTSTMTAASIAAFLAAEARL